MTTFTVPTAFTVIDRFTRPVVGMGNASRTFADKIEAASARAERSFRKLSTEASNVGRKSAIFGAALAAPLVLAAKSAIDYQDKLADVAKTTGLSGKGLDNFSNSIIDLSTNTRTSIDDLLKIGEIGGQLGIAEKDLLSFVTASNQFNIALGKDFSGGVEEAVTQVGKIKSLFGQTKGLSVSDAIMKTGSAINLLGAEGAATSSGITDFTLRIGALPNALKPSLTNTLALGTLFEELGLTSEIAAGGVTKFLLEAGQNIGGFAKQMNITSTAAKTLLKNDPTKFITMFSKTFEGVAPDVLAKKLKKLGLNSQEVIKIVGALGGNLERLTKLQNFSNDAFREGTSLAIEAATKEDTVAAKIAKMKNNFMALGIVIGTELLPVIADLIKEIMPVVKTMSTWVKENKDTVLSIAKIVGALAGFSFLVSGIAFVVSGFATTMQFLSWITPIATDVILGFNAAILANPVGAMVIGVALLVAAMLEATGGWDVIARGFKDGGIIGGIKAIGAALYDFLLLPTQQLLMALAKIPGLGGLGDTANNLAIYRASLGLREGIDMNFVPQFNKPNMTPGAGVLKATPSQGIVQDALNYQIPAQAVNPKMEENKRRVEELGWNKRNDQNTTITIKDETGRASVDSDGGAVPISLQKSLKFGR